ncbi:MAG: hypothetical protein QXS85_00580 [Acidilobaceae archaeon]
MQRWLESFFLEKSLERAVSESLGGRFECRRMSFLGSAYLCKDSSRSVVAKVYDALSTLKWVLAILLSRPAIGYRVLPVERLASELAYSRRLERCVKTFKAIGVVEVSGYYTLLRDYLPGAPLLERREPRAWRLLGETLARIHGGGVALGDANPGNFILSEGEVAVVDLEQAREMEESLAAWDLVTLLIHSQVRGVSLSLIVETLEGYAEDGEALRRARRELRNPRVWTPYMLVAQPLIPHALLALRRAGYL